MGFIRKAKKDVLPYDMFDLAKQAYEAKTGDKLEKIYHRGQERAWSGKEILPMLVKEYGEPSLSQEKKEALGRIFAIILWGELAAWKISAQLADAIEPLEARMAATSQAHDEARHFYSMYDYLTLLGFVPEKIDRLSEKVLENTLKAETLAQKVCGMQLMIETIALTIFQTVRQSRVEPVLAELLRYFEVDEARHIGLGINYMPFMIKNMSRAEKAGLMLFQMKLLFWVLASLRAMAPDLKTLGINPRTIVELGRAKQFEVFREMWQGLGVDIKQDRPLIARIFEAADEVLFPENEKLDYPRRIRNAWRELVAKQSVHNEGFLKEATKQLHDDETVLPGMGVAGSTWKKKAERSKRRSKASGSGNSANA